MAKGFKHGAGGSNVLNFKVVGNPQPTNPRENTIWIDTDTKITGYQFSAEYQGKNLLELTATSKTQSGVTFTINEDGSVVMNGTATDRILLVLANNLDYATYSGMVLNGAGQNASSGCYLYADIISSNGWLASCKDLGSGATITTGVESATYINIVILVSKGQMLNNVTFYPMIRLAGTDDTYEPYGGAKEGTVWISTSFYSTSEFNALKKNGIQVYPSYAKQYVNGTWVTKEVKIYQGGAWKQPWDGKLFSGGAFRVISGLNGTGVGATVRIEGSNLFINADNEYAWPYSIERIDLTNVKTIVVKMESPSFTWNNNPYGGFGVYQNIPTKSDKGVAYKHFNTESPRGEYALDVSGLNGEYYLGFMISDTSAKAAVYYISEIRLER